MLEAAVVLEAWGGASASEALTAGRALMVESTPGRQASAAPLPEREPREQYTFESVAFVIAVLAIACWTAPLGTRVSAQALEDGLTVALPLTLLLQWWLRSRYLGRRNGVTLLGRRSWILPTAGLALVAVSAVVLGAAGLVASLLVLVWSGGTILVSRHWSVGYVVVVMVGTAAMATELDALGVLAAVALTTGLAAVAAVRTPCVEATASTRPGRLGRALVAAVLGGAVGVMLVADRTADWGSTAVPALSLIPSAVASVWAGYRLWGFQEAIPESLCGVPVGKPEPSRFGSGLRILLAATTRLVTLTTALSVLLLFVASLVGAAVGTVGVLVGFGLVALATMLVSLLEAVARPGPALLALGCAIPAEMVVQWQDLVGFAGGGLVVGASLAVVLAAPPAVVLMRRSATTLATSLWIP